MQDKIRNRWFQEKNEPETGDIALRRALLHVTRPIYVIRYNGTSAVSQEGSGCINPNGTDGYPLEAFIPDLYPEYFGDDRFKKTYGLRYAYVAGAMANGITSVKMVEAAGRAGMIGFFGAAGLSPDAIDAAIHQIDHLQSESQPFPFGFNLIHSPNDPDLEASTVQLYLKRKIRQVSASAYMELTLPLILYRVKGIHRTPEGDIVCPNRVLAKVSRVEVARRFFSPPPDKFLTQLLERHWITEEEARLAKFVPVAEDLTAEADSGGHTDNRPAISLLPAMIALRDEMAEKFSYAKPPCVGLGGGISTPEATAAAFAMGAAYVLTGSVNQSCIEAGTSEAVRHMLAEAGQADITMAPAADMFEMGVKVQVLKRGTMFPQRAAKLYDFYSRHDRYEDIPEKHRMMIERDMLRCGFNEEWERTEAYFKIKDPKQILRAESDPKHKMALVFRSYLGRSSRWAVTGDPTRKIDYQIWCGPSLGAFNEWVKGSFLEKPENRKTVTVAMNLLLGAAVVTRANWLRCQGVPLSPKVTRFSPMQTAELQQILGEPTR